MKRLALLTGLIAGALMLSGCRQKPQLPPSPVPDSQMEFSPPAIYQRWFTHVEQCAGLKGDISEYRWYLVNKPLMTLVGRPGLFAGLTFTREKKVLLGLFFPADSIVVSHEQLHLLLAQNGISDPYDMHPAEFFLDRCAKVVGPVYH